MFTSCTNSHYNRQCSDTGIETRLRHTLDPGVKKYKQLAAFTSTPSSQYRRQWHRDRCATPPLPQTRSKSWWCSCPAGAQCPEGRPPGWRDWPRPGPGTPPAGSCGCWPGGLRLSERGPRGDGGAKSSSCPGPWRPSWRRAAPAPARWTGRSGSCRTSTAALVGTRGNPSPRACIGCWWVGGREGQSVRVVAIAMWVEAGR